MSNKLVKKSNLGDLSYVTWDWMLASRSLKQPYLEDGTKMLF
ncbi:MAG: hypothetical protein ACLVBP_15610 [Ruminococcus sp.]